MPGAVTAVLVADELDGRGEVVALAAFFVRARDLEEQRMHRPRLRRAALSRRLLADREVRHRLRALAVRGSDAVSARVAAADHDDVLAAGIGCTIRVKRLLCSRER